MLRPQDNVAREARRLDGLWAFQIDSDGVGRDGAVVVSARSRTPAMPVPASYNDVLVDQDVHDHVGDVWYQRTVFVPAGWDGRRVVLRFDAACHRATVWFDDEQVAEHEGGYTPFEADVTELVRPGHEHRVTVAVNNELTWQTLPPGIVSLRADGRKQVHYYHDFFNYGGLHRSVWLSATPLAHIDDLTDRHRARREHRRRPMRRSRSPGTPTRRSGSSSATRPASCRRRGARASTELRVPDAHLWQPGAAYLYDLRVDLVDGDERRRPTTSSRSASARCRSTAPGS